MIQRTLTDLAVLSLTVALAAPAAATDFPSSRYLSGDWGGARDRWKAAGIEVGLSWTAEPMANVSGGEVRGGTYADNIGLDLTFDLERLLGLPATRLLVKGSKRDGLSVSERFVAPSEGGNAFPLQELYGGQNVKLANVQFDTRLLDDRLDLAYGRLIANDDFLRSDLYCQFLNNSYCGSPKAVFYQNPFTFSAYPVATWGARARYDTASRVWTIQLAVYDGDIEGKAGDPASPGHNAHGTSWGWGDNGVTLAGEIHYHRNRDSSDALPGVYKLGGYYMNGDFAEVASTSGATRRGNAMGWLLADQMLYRASPGADRGLWGFGALVFSLGDDTNPMTWYMNAGLVYQGLFPGRPRDRTGLAVSSGWFGDALNDARRAQGLAEQDYEAVIELNHLFDLGHGIGIQPDLQYIIRPAGTGEIDNALAIGAKLNVQF